MTAPVQNPPENTPERQQKVVEQVKSQKEAIRDAKDEIAARFQELRKKIRTPGAEFSESVVLMVLQNPLTRLQQEIEAEIKSGDGTLDAESVGINGKKIRDAVDTAKAYLDKMTKETGGITPEVLVKMTRDMNKKASRMADLIISGQNRDLLDAYRAALGNTEQGTDLPTEEKRAIVTIVKYLNSEFENDNLMPYVWSVLAFMHRNQRIEVGQKYCDKKTPAQIENFLKRGNEMGAFSFDEIEEINKQANPERKYSDSERKNAFTNWKTHNDYRMEAAKLALLAPGTLSAAGLMLTIPNFLLGFLQFGAVASAVGHFMTGTWAGGKFKGLGAGIKRMAEPPALAAIAAFTAVEVYRSKEKFAAILAGDKPKEEAKQNLIREKKGNAQFPLWDEFFRQQNFAGATVFFDYMQYLKKFHEETDISKLYVHLTPAKFSEFLGSMAAKKKTNPEEGGNYDYAALKKGFDAIKAPELMNFAKILDTLNIGGANVKNNYEQGLEEEMA